MRSPFAYTPRPGLLQAASPGAAVVYLGSLVAVAFLYSSPVVLVAVGVSAAVAGTIAGAGSAVRWALRMGLTLAMVIVAVNGMVVGRGETVLARLGDWPVLGRVDVTGEALAAGAAIGLRAAVAMVVLAVYSSCVDPDRVLRALRPLARRSALTATLISRLAPVAAADAARIREAGRLRGPAAAPVGRAVLMRRILAGSLDRAVDAAATLELRGYGVDAGSPTRLFGSGASRLRSRHDARFYAVGATVIGAALIAKALGADAFDAYPTLEVGLGASTITLSAVVLAAGLAPIGRRRVRPRAPRAGAPATRREAPPRV